MQFEPLGTVAGIAAYTTGFRKLACAGSNRDPDPVVAGSAESFFNQLWGAAIDRLHEHAAGVGADGVLGVSVDQRPVDAGWQLQLSGTALRLPAAERLPVPFLSALPMRAFLTLLAAGWMPAGIVWGNAAVHVHGAAASPSLQGVNWRNAEMAGPTSGVNAARARAEAAVHRTLRASGAHGAVGMTIDMQHRSQACWGSNVPGMMFLANAWGTGVVRYRDPALRIVPARALSREAAR